ncbi:endoplasmic reticulum protein [Coprinopsis cinerea AmutBmut pab1-1]|nr:endoplasmic reticulum protein [Coprinopsis cinerea AmutBmut pab1-1]
MLYDKNPPYPHYDHLPYAKEPWKSLYVFQRLFTTLALVPWWVAYYSVVPRSFRPRESWNLRQIVNVNFTRRIFKVTEVAGVTWGTRDPTVAPDPSSLKETDFVWVEPLKEEFRTGILREEETPPYMKVGCYVWPGKDKTLRGRMKAKLRPSTSAQKDDDRVHLVGVFMHGGGYCHMSAHESSRTSRMPRGFIQRGILDEVYSVEYRLLQVAPFPAVVQDAATVYSHVVEKYTAEGKRFKIFLIGDSSGGNLVLALARWLRDEGKLRVPDGLVLLSPSCDTSHNLPQTLSSYIPRPNQWSDYLVDNPEPRALLQRTFLGFKHQEGPSTQEEELRLMRIVHSNPEGEHSRNFWKYGLPNLPSYMKSTRVPANLDALKKLGGSWVDSDNPYRKTCQFPGLFASFPKTIIVCGDAERLVREVRSLASAMKKDGVDLTMYWAPDACHDPLMLNEFWWDKKVLDGIWEQIDLWSKEFRESGTSLKAEESKGLRWRPFLKLIGCLIPT